VVDEGGTGVPVTTNGNTLEHTVGGVGNDVVQLVGHTSGLGDVGDGTRAVQLGGDDVVHHTTSVANLERTGLDATNGSGADDGDTLLLGDVEDLTGTLQRSVCRRRISEQGTHTLGDTLSDDGNGLDLGELEELHGGRVYGARRGEVDDMVDISVLRNGLVHRLVDGQQRLAGSPVPVGRC
jgi:hypothetical protein